MVCVLVLCRAGAILLLRHGLSVDNLEVTVCLLGMSPPADDDVLDSTSSMPTWNGTLRSRSGNLAPKMRSFLLRQILAVKSRNKKQELVQTDCVILTLSGLKNF